MKKKTGSETVKKEDDDAMKDMILKQISFFQAKQN